MNETARPVANAPRYSSYLDRFYADQSLTALSKNMLILRLHAALRGEGRILAYLHYWTFSPPFYTTCSAALIVWMLMSLDQASLSRVIQCSGLLSLEWVVSIHSCFTSHPSSDPPTTHTQIIANTKVSFSCQATTKPGAPLSSNLEALGKSFITLHYNSWQ